MAKILLVEDEINIASFIERGLQEFGHEVRVANDGQAGWELVQQEDFQLLILGHYHAENKRFGTLPALSADVWVPVSCDHADSLEYNGRYR